MNETEQIDQQVVKKTAESPFAGKGEVFNVEQEQEWLKVNGYEPVKAGTYYSPESETFYYHKIGFETKEQAEAEAGMVILRGLAEIGVAHPQTKIGLVKTQHGFDVVATMPKIVAVNPESLKVPLSERPPALQKFYDVANADRAFGKSEGKLDYAFQLIENDTHMRDWLRRLMPGFSGEDASEAAMLVTDTLNIAEAAEFDNWGYDPESQVLYPVDFEVFKPVIQLSSENQQKVAEMIASNKIG